MRRRPLVDVLPPADQASIEIAASWPCATAQMMFFGPNAASPPKKTLGMGRLEGDGVDHRHAPFVEVDADVALDPGEGVLLADRHQHVVAFDSARPARRSARACGGPCRRRALRPSRTATPVRLPSAWSEFLGHEVVEDRDAFVHGVLLLPGRGLHLLEAGADDRP